MKRPLIAFLFLATAISAHAWTRAADHRIATRSAELAPRDLRLVIDHYRDEYLRGVDRALADEGSEIHRAKLRARIEAESRAIPLMIRRNEPMSVIVERLGILVHLVGDANNPYHVGSDDAEAHPDFERYLERRMAQFPPFFYGLERNFSLGPYLDRTFARSAHFSPLMMEEYSRDGEKRTSADFDDRSTAFGVASLCYSHAVTDVVNLYYFIWKEAGGNVRKVPQSVVMNAN